MRFISRSLRNRIKVQLQAVQIIDTAIKEQFKPQLSYMERLQKLLMTTN